MNQSLTTNGSDGQKKCSFFMQKILVPSSNIQNLCRAFRMRWLWLHKSDPARPWEVFQLQIHKKVQAFFSMAVVAEVGNGARTLFWSDKWIHGRSVADIAPRVIVIVPKRRTNIRTALEALTYHSWVSDVEDSFIWRFSSDGIYSPKSPYAAFFQGKIAFYR